MAAAGSIVLRTMANDPPLILVSNDDGVEAAGIAALFSAIQHLGEVFMVAPETEQSAKSHSLTLHRPLRTRHLDERRHSVDGTPADCVYTALHHPKLLPRRPHLVVSGINHGPNLGNDVHYSGTVAAAREAAMRGIPAMAFSTGAIGLLESNAKIAASLIARLLEAELPNGHAPLLNVNFPRQEPVGLLATVLGTRSYNDELVIRQDPRGGEYLWIGGSRAHHPPMEAADTVATDNGYVSVTPLSVDATNPDHLDLATWVRSTE